MVPSFPISSFVADSAGRIRIPQECGAEWPAGKKLKLVPLKWKTSIDLPSDREMESWYLFDAAGGKSKNDWLISPLKILETERDDTLAAHLSAFIFDIEVEEHNKRGRRVTCPKLLRDLGWLARPGERIVIKPESAGISLWSELAFRLFFVSLNRQWQERQE